MDLVAAKATGGEMLSTLTPVVVRLALGAVAALVATYAHVCASGYCTTYEVHLRVF